MSAPDAGDWNAEDGVTAQLDTADTLVDRGVKDPLDEGFSPPDFEPKVRVPTAEEERDGCSLDELLAAEVPEVGSDGVREWPEDHEWGDEAVAGPGGFRAGRLIHGDDGGYGGISDDMTAGDVGIDGGGASAEEAAMHVFDPDEAQDDEDESDPAAG